MKLSDTARVVLSRAAQHPERLAEPPKHLPAAARDAVVRSLVKNSLLAEIACPREHLALAWRQDDAGVQIALMITDAGLSAIGIEALPDKAEQPAAVASHQSEPERDVPAAGLCESHAPVPPGALSAGGEGPEPPVAPAVGQHGPTPRGQALRNAASAVLAAWSAEGRPGLDEAIESVRAVLAKPARAAREPGAPRKPRDGTKQQQVLALLRRTEGASGPAIAEATGWAPHTVRGFLAGLAKKGIKVEVLDRVRQVGPGKEGAKGSYTIYRIAEAA